MQQALPSIFDEVTDLLPEGPKSVTNAELYILGQAILGLTQANPEASSFEIGTRAGEITRQALYSLHSKRPTSVSSPSGFSMQIDRSAALEYEFNQRAN